ncbi:MAG: hypothetical protein Ta2E_12860 [Mycoplasmoidaceae bacterium]|nr:MAG: hypothetical protein Ta2E_12860 [Mycoplasmoidaceae bacterium]
MLQKGVTFSEIIHDNIGHLSDPKGHPYQLYTMYLSHSKRLKNQTAQEYMEAQFNDWLTITDSNIDSAINSAMQISKTKISYLRNRSSALEAKNDKKTSITTLLKLLTNRENRKVKGFIREFVFDLNVPNFVGTKYISPCTFKNLQKSLKSSSAPVDYSFLMGQMLPTKLEAEYIMISSLITPKDICQTILDYSNGASKIKASQLLKNIVEKVGWDPATIWKWCLIDLNASNFENEIYKVNTVDVILDNTEPKIEDEMFEYRDYNIIIKERSSK